MKHFKNKEQLRIAHISDLHFAKVTFSLTQFFSKRFIGNTNLFLRRQREFRPSLLKDFAQFLKAQKVDIVLITGDFSTTARDIEFEMAFDFLDELKQSDFTILCIPGNHDHYTKKAYLKRRFYDFFDHDFEYSFPYTLKKDAFEIHPLGKNMWWIGLDTARSTPLFASYGVYDEKLNQNLQKALSELPKDDLIVFANHFPFHTQDGKKNHSLLGAKKLEQLLQNHPQVKLFLHGHKHKHTILDLREKNLPICIDSGSASHQVNGTFNIYDLAYDVLSIYGYKANHYLPTELTWEPFFEKRFILNKN